MANLVQCIEVALLLQGVLLQIFSKPLSDRPTVFIEIIQRIGCEKHLPGVPVAKPLLFVCVPPEFTSNIGVLVLIGQMTLTLRAIPY